jgi:ELWxxDGT repeat protein
VNGLAVFPGLDAAGCEPWRTDGITAQRIADINPGPANATSAFVTSSFQTVGKLVLFGADDGVHGIEMWATDGNSVRQLQDIAADAGSSNPRFFVAAGNLVYFTADDHIVGAELWAMTKSAVNAAFRR